MNAGNKNIIKFLEELDEDACVLIFTRHDAEALADRRIEDDQWKDIVDRFGDHYPNEVNWDEFWYTVKEVLGE